MSFMKKTGKALADVIPGLGHFTFDPTVGKIFVTSGTGVIGWRVAVSLLEAGHKNVRVGIWKGDVQGDQQGLAPKCWEVLESKGAELVEFDWSKPDEYGAALKDVKTVFCSIPRFEGWADCFPMFLRECKLKKVEHFVKLSFLRATQTFKGFSDIARQYRENVPFVSFHGTCDDLLQLAKNDSRISYTILCTSHLMATPLLHQGKILREEHKFITASYGMGVNYVSPNDVADAAVVVLLNQKPHRNTVYNLTGPGPIKDSQVVKLLTQAYGMDIDHVELGYHDYAESVEKRGLPKWMVRDSAAFERMKASGVDEQRDSYTKDVESVTGHKPETFKDYLSNRSSMRPGLKFP